MARRRKKQTQAEMISEMMIKIIMASVVLIVFNYAFMKKYVGSMIGGSWLNPLLIILVIILTSGLGIYLANNRMKLERANINQIDKMSGTEFEHYLELFFKKQGWKVKRIGGQGDYGADLILASADKKIVVQAKRWKQNVGYEAIQQAYTSKDIYECNEAWVVTNSGFTEQAIDAAKRLGVQLWNRNILIEKMAEVNAATTLKPEAELPAEIEPQQKTHVGAENLSDVCVTCGKPVTPKVREYCLANVQRFNNRIYCYEHQRKSL